MKGSVSRRSALRLAGGAVFAGVLGMTGCGSATASSGSAASGGKKSVVCATEGAYAPYNYVGSDGSPDGYDIALVKAVAEKLGDYEFTYKAISWDSIFSSLDAQACNMISSEISRTDEREQKYVFSDVVASWMPTAVAFRKGEGYASLADVAGKTLETGASSSWTVYLDDYNAKNGNPVTVSYTDGDASKMLQDLLNGRCDGVLGSPVTFQNTADEQGLEIEWFIPAELPVDETYVIFESSDFGRALKEAFDPVLQQLLDDGTVKGISEKYLGADYSTEDAVKAQMS